MNPDVVVQETQVDATPRVEIGIRWGKSGVRQVVSLTRNEAQEVHRLLTELLEEAPWSR